MTRRRGRLLVMPALLMAGIAARASAQTSLQVPLQFDFLNPGAKSLALGGAFAGVADDATATFANPAGLILLSQPEVSIELRGSSYDAEFLESGRLSGTVLNEGLDTIPGPSFGISRGTHLGPGFLSAVYPSRSNRWVVAGFRHELLRVDQSFLSTGVFQQLPGDLGSQRDFPQEGLRNVSITTYGGMVGWVPRRNVAIGGGVSVYRFSIDSVFRRFDTRGFLGPPNPSVELGRSSQVGEDYGVAPTLGLLLGTASRVRVGVVFRRGASFEFQTVDGTDPERDVTFRVPDTLAAGVSFRPRPEWLLAGEVTYVRHSRLVQDFVVDQARGVGLTRSFAIDNGTEVHLGAQYVALTKRWAPKFRLGAWYDPDHSVRYRPERPPQNRVDLLFDELMSTALSTGGDRVHVTGGVGFSITPRIELNAAADLAAGSRVFSTSLILRTGS
ncbi:MAG: OmpP1/FadL family transporter [Vicinamibacterales bacterium]